jgi:hypothetical protein
MGLNYYLCIKDDDTNDLLEILDQARKMIEKGIVRNARYELEELVELLRTKEKTIQIHIGKSSNGSFTFDHQNWNYFSTREELVNFLKSGSILCEDGTEMSFDQFWGKIVNCEDEATHFGLSFSDSVNFS